MSDFMPESIGIAVSCHDVEGELYIRRAAVPAGLLVGKHVHDYDHASALISGTVRLTVDGQTREVTGPKIVLIEANKEHTIEAVTPVVWHCIHIDTEAL